MLDVVLERLRQGHRTSAYPRELPVLPDRFRGRPVIDQTKCLPDCRACADACPTDAVHVNGTVRIDLGRCLFCTECVQACPAGAIQYTQEYRLAARRREDLWQNGQAVQLAAAL